jgi:hypothetical protein
MKPKEKAQELYNKMVVDMSIEKEQSKLCAIVTVDEILYFIHTDVFSYTNEEYWQEVKHELEKL